MTEAAKDALAVTLTRAELEALVERSVRKVIGARDGGSRLVDKQNLARLLGCSAAHVDMLRKRGLPTVRVGQAVRFEPETVVAWLKTEPGSAANGGAR